MPGLCPRITPPPRKPRELFRARLHRIAIDRGWFLEHGHLEPNKSRAVRHQINKLCRELRPHALALVDGFGIPDAVLGARIGVAE